MLRKSLSIVSLFLLLALFLAACRRGDEVAELTPVAGLTATAIVQPATVAATATTGTTAATPTNTATPLAVVSTTATAIPASPTAQPLTATPQPLPLPATATATVSAGPPPGGSARITFGPGATSAVVQSNLAAGGDGDTWLLRVLAGQTITVQTIANPPGRVVVSLLDMSGGSLATNADTAAISATVPATGDYQINLATASGAPAVAYTMQVFVPPAGGPVTPTRITFAPGQSSAQVNDALAAGGDLNSYVLAVAAGQTIQAAVFASPPAATNIVIRNAAGQVLTSGTDMSGASATAATAGDYFIDVSNVNAAPAVSYTLTVTVPPTQPPPPAQPTRITFAPGQASAQVNDALAAGGDLNSYVLAVAAGQTIQAAVFASPPAATNIVIRNAAGQTLANGTDMSGASATAATAGDYFIDVSNVNAAPAVSYTLTVTVPPTPPPPPAQATRISFGPGQISAQLDGALSAGQTALYVLNAAAGQTLITDLNDNPLGNVDIAVLDAAGNTLNFGRAPTSLGTRLAATGDVTIRLSSATAAGYTLIVTVPPLAQAGATRISFAPGATSATVSGDLPFGGDLDTYVLGGGAGQVLTVTAAVAEASGWTRLFVYNAAGQLIGLGTDITGVSAPLAAAGDYAIVIVSDPAAGPLSYALTATIP